MKPFLFLLCLPILVLASCHTSEVETTLVDEEPGVKSGVPASPSNVALERKENSPTSLRSSSDSASPVQDGEAQGQGVGIQAAKF